MFECMFAGGGAFCQGITDCGLIQAIGKGALVSSCSILFVTCIGSLVMRPVLGKMMEERLVGPFFESIRFSR